MKQKGMTLASVLVAVALTSALAVVASKLVSNQAKLNKIMTLTDQRDMITRFYSALLHNRVVWRCTLYDSNNRHLLEYISDTTNSLANDKFELRTPDCKFKERVGSLTTPAGDTTSGIEELHTLTAAHGSGDHYRSSSAFFATNPMHLKESLTTHDADGWWIVELTADPIAKGSVDLVLTVTFDHAKYKTAHANFDPPDIRDVVTYKVRKGDPNVEGVSEDCADHAVVAIDDLATGIRNITCSEDPLVKISNLPPNKKGKFLHSLADGKETTIIPSARGISDPLDPSVLTQSHIQGRTGLRQAIGKYYAITLITEDGDYELTPVDEFTATNPAPGVLGFRPPLPGSPGVCLHNSPALSEIINGEGKWTNHQGPRGKQGLPGPHGHWGGSGDPGPPAPPCPATPPTCS